LLAWWWDTDFDLKYNIFWGETMGYLFMKKNKDQKSAKLPIPIPYYIYQTDACWEILYTALLRIVRKKGQLMTPLLIDWFIKHGQCACLVPVRGHKRFLLKIKYFVIRKNCNG